VSEPEKIESQRELTWDSQLALLLPGPPIAGVTMITACLIAVYWSSTWIFDLKAYRGAFLMALLIAYILMVPRYLNSHDDRESEIESLRFCHDDIRRSRWFGALGVLLAFTINEVAAVLEGADPIGIFTRIHDGTVVLPITLFLGWVVGRSIYFSRASSGELPLPDSSAIDLLHLDSLYAIGRTGLRRAFVGLVGVGIGGLLVLDTVFGLWVTVPIFAIGLIIGLVVLLRPARKVRNLIRDVKRTELTRLELLLRQARDDTLSGEGSNQGRLTDLMAYRDQVESTVEWPFNSSTITRFGLYLLIPVASMVGGALVERVVDGLLG